MTRHTRQRRILLAALLLLAAGIATPAPAGEDVARPAGAALGAPGAAAAPEAAPADPPAPEAARPADSLAASGAASAAETSLAGASPADSVPDRDDPGPAPLRVLRKRVRALRVIVDVLLGLVESGLSRGAWQPPLR